MELLVSEKWKFGDLKGRFVSQEEFLLDKTQPITKEVNLSDLDSLTDYEAKFILQKLMQ